MGFLLALKQFHVFTKEKKKGLEVCRGLLEANRVHFIAPADYSENSILEKRMKLLLKSVITSITYEKNCSLVEKN